MTERQGLLIKAERFLASARLLAESSDLDSAVSRVYYAAFYVAQALLDALGISFSSHRGVISAFGKEFAQKGRLDPRFHRLLITAFEKRQQADYWVKTGLELDEVGELLAETDSFIHAAKGWLTQEGLLEGGHPQ